MWWIKPPRKAISVPARMPTKTSQSAEVREKRGSTWIRVAPLALAFIGHRKPTGWASAMFEPIRRTQSDPAMSCMVLVAAPRPNEAPRPGTEAECQILA